MITATNALHADVTNTDFFLILNSIMTSPGIQVKSHGLCPYDIENSLLRVRIDQLLLNVIGINKVKFSQNLVHIFILIFVYRLPHLHR